MAELVCFFADFIPYTAKLEKNIGGIQFCSLVFIKIHKNPNCKMRYAKKGNKESEKSTICDERNPKSFCG